MTPNRLSGAQNLHKDKIDREPMEKARDLREDIPSAIYQMIEKGTQLTPPSSTPTHPNLGAPETLVNMMRLTGVMWSYMSRPEPTEEHA